MDNLLLYKLLTFLILLLLVAFFNASEVALFSLTNAQIKNMIRDKIHQWKLLQKFLKNPQSVLISIVLGTMTFTLFISSFSASFAIDICKSLNINVSIGIVLSTLIVSSLVIIFGEIIPKTLAMKNSKYYAMLILPFLQFIHNLLFPLRRCFELITDAFVNAVSKGQKLTPATLSVEEFKTAVAVGKTEGFLKEDESKIITEIFDFRDSYVKDVMTPKEKITGISIDNVLSEVMETIRKHPFSRYPVYNKTMDDIDGILYVKDIVQSCLDSDYAVPVTSLMKVPHFVPMNEKTSKLFSDFQKNNFQIAVVIEEFGRAVGLVTMEDITEEIIGEI